MRLFEAVRNHHGSGIGVSEAVFHAHNVSKIYNMGEVEVQALRSVTLDLYEGEFLVLLGPSGSGKSTLLNILGALDIPSSVMCITEITFSQRRMMRNSLASVVSTSDLYSSSTT
jgi:putative ABC transport system ATP-binding protein